MSTPTRLAVAALGTVAMGMGLTLAAPATAAPDEVVYDALGDSYAAGFGAGAVLQDTGGCSRTDAAAPLRLDGRQRIALDDFVACSGATTADLAGQLPALDADTDLVTLTIGGNDIGWTQAIGACLLLDDPTCAQALAGSRLLVQGLLPARLDAALTAVGRAAPDAHVVVTGYPHLFTPEAGGFVNASPEEQEALNEGADLLNATVAAAAQRRGFDYVDVVRRFDGHGVNAPDPWVDPTTFHPTVAGQETYAAALTAAVAPQRRR
ncbi:SGNH/GDSL hydrolase family protein [uncultured Serinicoccus sp.]|uniref:SGNH/GDSL hydrolase family protein n=1 Tax=uncultured Serinicoccus sp. TaxID=735514 RepID=UPI002604A8E6|nr:SGNH/GDSL hydrolase family protein [uncultured Serinicoccus sp.]